MTGSCGLVGSAVVEYYAADSGCQIVGLDNNSRAKWFGKSGSVTGVRYRLEQLPNYRHVDGDIVDADLVSSIICTQPNVIIHCAGQPSHDKSAEIPIEDFKVNALGTLNLLEATRKYSPGSPFVFLSTNKVYGTKPNEIPLAESFYRLDFATKEFRNGISELLSIDQSVHSPFGVSKTAADLMVQEYGRYFGLYTVCFRCGCITGPSHQGVELHGFLSYLCRCAVLDKEYVIYGHGGKQVRDNIHAADLVTAIDQFLLYPKGKGEVYNMGGGYENSCSVLEAIQMVEQVSGKKIKVSYGPARKGDHVCYYTDLSKFRQDYPNWKITRDLHSIIEEVYEGCRTGSNLRPLS